MRRVEIDRKAVTIQMPEEEMPTGREAVSRLVERMLREAGLEPWPAVEAECFCAGGEVLVLARPGRARLEGFFFGDFESLLRGAAACGAGESALYAAEGGYLLVTPAGSVYPALREYGSPRGLHPDWESHAREQGQCLLETDAIAQLVRIFSTSRV